jgi:DNA topoisomerase-3
MTQQAIRDGFSRLRAARRNAGLADAAVCRSESDWLVGINGTRAMTAFNSKTGGFHLTTVGRVQTPTLALMVEREDKIRKFKPRAYWEVEGVFACAAGEYKGKWFDENFSQGQRRGRRTPACRPALGRSACQGAAGTSARPNRAGQRRSQALDAALAAALRPHQPAARSQQPFRLFGQSHAWAWRRRCTKNTRC